MSMSGFAHPFSSLLVHYFPCLLLSYFHIQHLFWPWSEKWKMWSSEKYMMVSLWYFSLGLQNIWSWWFIPCLPGMSLRVSWTIRYAIQMFCCFLSAPGLRIKPVVCLSHSSLVCRSLAVSVPLSVSVSVCGGNGHMGAAPGGWTVHSSSTCVSALRVEELLNDRHVVAENHRKVRELRLFSS